MKRYEHRYENKNIFVSIAKVLTDIAVVAAVAVFIFSYFGETVGITGYSMDPVLTNGDVVMIDKFTYSVTEIKRFDVVVFSGGLADNIYVKRVIGMPGETVQIKGGAVYIDGKLLKENIETEAILSSGLAEQPITLGADEYFVLGDNRNNSDDSRFSTVGNVKRNNIIGKAWLEVTGIKDFGFIK